MYSLNVSLPDETRPKVKAIKSLTDIKLATVLRPIIEKEIDKLYAQIPEKSRNFYTQALTIDEII